MDAVSDKFQPFHFLTIALPRYRYLIIRKEDVD